MTASVQALPGFTAEGPGCADGNAGLGTRTVLIVFCR